MKNHPIPITVECYSGYTAHERPLRLIIGDTTLGVCELVDRWYGPDHRYFKVMADDGNTYIIRHGEKTDEWELEFFRKEGD